MYDTGVPDALDRRLLAILQADAARPVASMAQEVGLSVPACYRRIRRLRTAGIIVREVAVVRPKSLGWPLSMIVLVALEREGPSTIEELALALRSEPEVMEAWNVTGDFDIALRVIARDMEGYDTLVQRLLSADDRVRSFQTLVVIRDVKERAAIPSGT